MKIPFLTAILITQLFGHSVAGTYLSPDTPVPKLSMTQMLSIAEKHRPKDALLVGVEWCRSSDFQHRALGSYFIPPYAQPNAYSWFLTYVYKNEEFDKELKSRGISQRFNSFFVVRLMDDGTFGTMIGVQ
jgi:hypothetical protein